MSGDINDSSRAAPATATSIADTAPTDERVGREAPDRRRQVNRAGLVVIYPRAGAGDVGAEAWQVRRRTLVGRGGDAAVRLTDRRVSRVHATVDVQGDGLLVCDLGSRHGTFLRGERVGPAGTPARAGDVVRFGDTLM